MNHVIHKSKGCRLHILGGECVECYQDYYLTHNNVCKICPPSFLKTLKKRIVILQYIHSFVINML